MTDAELQATADRMEQLRLIMHVLGIPSPDMDLLYKHVSDVKALLNEVGRLQPAVHELEEMVSAAESRANERGREIERLRAVLEKQVLLWEKGDGTNGFHLFLLAYKALGKPTAPPAASSG